MKKTSNISITGIRQKDNIIRGLPFGVYSEKFMRGSVDSETRSIRKSYHELKKKTVFIKTPMDNKGILKRVNRDTLNNDLIMEILSSTCPDYLLENMPLKKSITVRGDEYHKEPFYRLVRSADTQNFLYSCKVETPFTVLTKYYANPFVFGIPDATNEQAEKASLFDVLSQAMYETVRRTELPSVVDIGSVQCVYYSNRYNEIAKRAKRTDKKNIARTFNNSVGMLLDFANRCGYMIFKFLLSREMIWYPRAYANAMNGLEHTSVTLTINNYIYGTRYFDTALILCETPSEYASIIQRGASIPDLGECFINILPIKMTETGIAEIDALLSMGIKEYIKSYDDEMISALGPELNLRKVGSRFVAADGSEYYNGTYMNIKTMNRIKKIQDTRSDDEQKVYIVCFQDQKPIYCKNAGIDSNHIIAI